MCVCVCEREREKGGLGLGYFCSEEPVYWWVRCNLLRRKDAVRMKREEKPIQARTVNLVGQKKPLQQNDVRDFYSQ
ncbi:hypothetical protein PAMP_001172 [Pampus punctatissimus]